MICNNKKIVSCNSEGGAVSKGCWLPSEIFAQLLDHFPGCRLKKYVNAGSSRQKNSRGEKWPVKYLKYTSRFMRKEHSNGDALIL
jgi:hypothetical protein